MKCQILLFRKNKKSIIKLSSVESAHSVVSVKQSKRKSILATCIRASAKALISTKSTDFFFFFLSSEKYCYMYSLEHLAK